MQPLILLFFGKNESLDVRNLERAVSKNRFKLIVIPTTGHLWISRPQLMAMRNWCCDMGVFLRNCMKLQSGSWIQNLNSIALMVACTCRKILFNSLVKLQWSKEAESPYGWSEGGSPPTLCPKRSSKLCNQNLLPKPNSQENCSIETDQSIYFKKYDLNTYYPPKRKVIKNQDHHRSPVQTYPPWNYHNPF